MSSENVQYLFKIITKFGKHNIVDEKEETSTRKKCNHRNTLNIMKFESKFSFK